MKIYIIAFLLFSVFFIISCNKSRTNTDVKIVTSISAQDLKIELEKNKNLYIIDVRTKNEFYGKVGHIEGSELIPLHTLAESIKKLQQINDTIYVVCLSGKRSAVASKILRNNDINALNLSGGMLSWNKLN